MRLRKLNGPSCNGLNRDAIDPVDSVVDMVDPLFGQKMERKCRTNLVYIPFVTFSEFLEGAVVNAIPS